MNYINGSVKQIIEQRISEYDKKRVPNEIKGDNRRGEAFQLFAVETVKNIKPDKIKQEDRIDKKGREYLVDFFFVNENFSEVDIICAQTGPYNKKTLSDFKIGFDKIFLGHDKLENDNLESKRKKIWRKRESIEMINIFFCTISISEEIKSYFQKLESDLRSRVKTDYKKAKINVFPTSGSGLMVYEKKLLSKEIGQYTLRLKDDKKGLIQNNFNREVENVSVALVSIKDLLKIYKIKGDLIFYLNIREDLGLNQVNKGLLKDLKDINGSFSNYFWCLNNGLTIVCDEFCRETNSSVYSISNPIIINGQQTLRTLNLCRKSIKKDHFVLCKIVTTSDIDFIEKITETSNSQTAIKYQDLKSNHTTLICLEELFKYQGMILKRKKGKRGKILPFSYSSKIVAQSVMSILMSQPNIGRLGKDKILFDEYFEEIFSKDYKKIILAILIYDNVKKCIKSILNKNKLEINKFVWHIAYNIFNKNIRLSKNINIDKLIKEYKNMPIKDQEIKTEYNSLYKRIPKEVIESHSIGSYLNKEESLKIIKK